VARIGQIIPAQLIRHDKQNISYCRHGNRSSNHHRI
jgi:3-mercaptopyruvate sulfurtransferase SseA